MATDNMTAILLQNFDENINIELDNTEKYSKNICTKSLTGMPDI